MIFELLLVLIALVTLWLLISCCRNRQMSGTPSGTPTVPSAPQDQPDWAYPNPVLFTPRTCIPIPAARTPPNTTCLPLPLGYSRVTIRPSGDTVIINNDGTITAFNINNFGESTTGTPGQNASTYDPLTGTWAIILPAFTISEGTLQRTFTTKVTLSQGSVVNNILPSLTFDVTGSAGCMYTIPNDVLVLPQTSPTR